VKSTHIPELAALARRAVGGVVSAPGRVGPARARIGRVSRALARPEPRMPPELAARIDEALAAEVARARSISLPSPRSRPGPLLGPDEWRNRNIPVPSPRRATLAP
jgi:hypothetical protein